MISCYRITDYALATGLLMEQWDLVSEDGNTVRVPDVLNEFWIGINENSECAGFVRVASVGAVLYECHICIRPDYRDVREYCFAAMKWALENIHDMKKLICNVPDFKSGAIALAQSVGFVKQGFNPEAFLKNGKLFGVVQLGITRKQMEDICPQQQQL